MFKMKWVQYFHYYLIFLVLEVTCISNYSNDKPLITEEDRRAAEKLENTTPSSSITESKLSESKKRGVFLSAINRSPTSLIHPSLAIGYDNRDTLFGGSKYDRRPIHDDHHRDRPPPPHYYPSSSSDDRGGYPGRYPPTYAGDYGHSSGGGGGYDHLGPIEYDYPPTGGHGHPTGIGSHYGGSVGGHKNPLALKGLLLPLAGIALLGAAAALTTNPLLLQLGVVNGYKRRRRGLLEYIDKNNVYPTNHIVKPDEN